MEWDRDSFERRFLGTWCKARNVDGVVKWYYPACTDYDSDCILTVRDGISGKNFYTPIVNKEYPAKDLEEYGYENILDFLYETPKVGWYKTNAGAKYPYLLTYRKMCKSFKVGLSDDGFHVLGFVGGKFYGGKAIYADPDRYIKEGDLGEIQIIKDGLWISEEDVMFLGNSIGMRDGKKIVLKQPSFARLLKQELPEWQIVL